MGILFVSPRSDDLGMPSRFRPVAAELRPGAMMSPSTARLPSRGKLAVSAGFRNLGCPLMYASGLPGSSPSRHRSSATTALSWRFWAV